MAVAAVMPMRLAFAVAVPANIDDARASAQANPRAHGAFRPVCRLGWRSAVPIGTKGEQMPRIEPLDFVLEDDDRSANRQTASLAGLAVVLFLVVASLFLLKHLHHTAVVEDCLLSGRTNCDLLLASTF
jgi:hypothetical protein